VIVKYSTGSMDAVLPAIIPASLDPSGLADSIDVFWAKGSSFSLGGMLCTPENMGG
jgi:hypothetical protein